MALLVRKKDYVSSVKTLVFLRSVFQMQNPAEKKNENWRESETNKNPTIWDSLVIRNELEVTAEWIEDIHLKLESGFILDWQMLFRPCDIQRLVEIIHTSICGTISDPTLSGNWYFISFIDTLSKRCQRKCIDMFKVYKQKYKYNLKKIKVVNSDMRWVSC